MIKIYQNEFWFIVIRDLLIIIKRQIESVVRQSLPPLAGSVMKKFLNLKLVQYLLLAFISLFSFHVSAVVTYDGTNGVYNNVFSSNSVEACINCHSSTLVGDTNRYYAPICVNFDTYAWAKYDIDLNYATCDPADPTNLINYLANHERANVRIQGDTMPIKRDLVQGAPNVIYPTIYLNTTEKNLYQNWINDGALQRAAPEIQTWNTATSLGKYSGTIWARYIENGVSSNLYVRYDDDSNIALSPLGSYYLGNATGSGGNNSYSGWYSKQLTGLSCGTTYYMQGYTWSSTYSYTYDTAESFTTVACPSVSTTSLPAAQESVAYSTTVSSANSGPVANYSLTIAPAGMSIDASSGQINWTPPDAASNYSVNVTVQVSDGTTIGSKNFLLDVSANSDPPVITEGAEVNQTMPENTAYNFSLNATDVDLNTLDWTELQSASSGILSIVDGTGIAASFSYTPNFNYFGSDNFEIKVTDANGGFDTIQFNLKITSDDYDHDGVLNASDNCPNTAPGDQTDTDNDGEGNVCDDDDDGDGMPDTFENDNGLNPLVDDAADDADGDGITNYDEYIGGTDVNIDNVPPVVTPPADVMVNATGHLTLVELGEGSAVDIKDGVITPSPDKTGTFESGRHTISWSATDQALNTGTADQILDVIPFINFSVDQVAAEGASINVDYELSGDAASYPVTFDYIVSGNADSNDSDAVSGSAVINSGRTGSLTIDIRSDGVVDEGEKIIFTMQNVSNANAGEKIQHEITILESNVAPAVSLTLQQSGENRNVVYKDQGNVTVSAMATDANPTDVLSYDWSLTSTDVKAVNSNGLVSDSLEFDPATLAEGSYLLELEVSDAALITHVELLIKIEATAPVLSTDDSDGDGVTDDVEGVKDSDGDGISDYLDAIAQQNILQNQTGNITNQILIQTEAGLQVMLGQYALGASRKGASIAEDDIKLVTGLTSLPGLTLDGKSNIYDFEIHGLNQVKNSAYVVLPLQSGLQTDVKLYLYDDIKGWQLFVSSDVNQMMSADLNQSGFCPVVLDDAYTDSLTNLDNCIQLLIEDGGTNDADGEVNGVIRLTVAVAYSQTAADDDPKPADIGLMHPVWLLMVSVMLLFRKKRRI